MAPYFFERLDHLGHGRLLLADGDVEAVEPLPLLVDDGVDGDGGLAGLAVADDQLALAAADRHHGVDGLEAGLHRLVHRLALHDAGGLDLDLAGVLGVERAAAVDGVAEAVDHAAEQLLADRHLGDLAGALDRVALADVLVGAHDGGADVVLLEVEHQAADAVAEVEQLAGGGAGEAVDAGHAVGLREHGAGLGDVDLLAVVLDLVADDAADLVGADIHCDLSPGGSEKGCYCFKVARRSSSWVRSEPS